MIGASERRAEMASTPSPPALALRAPHSAIPVFRCPCPPGTRLAHTAPGSGAARREISGRLGRVRGRRGARAFSVLRGRRTDGE